MDIDQPMMNGLNNKRLRLFLGAVGLLVGVLLAYYPALRAGFVWDDDDHLLENHNVRNATPLDIWLRPTPHPQYFPLTWTTFWVEHRLWGFNPAGYHAVNILLHGLNAILLWVLLRFLRLPGAMLAAAFFALHPIEVESVAWVTERKNVLVGFFTLLSVNCYARFRRWDVAGVDPETNGRPVFFVSAFIFFVLALFSKTSVVALPFVLLALTWWRKSRLQAVDGWTVLPMVSAALALALLTLRFEFPESGGADGTAWTLGPLTRWQGAGRAFWFYLGKLLVPLNLTFVYPHWAIPNGFSWNVLFPLAAGLLYLGLWCFSSRIGRGPLAGMLVYGLLIGPLLGLVSYYYQRYSFVADHHQYLAGIPILTMLVQVLTRATAQWPARGRVALAMLPLALLALLTWRQAGIYHDAETLWRDTLKKNPACWMAHNNLGGILKQRGRLAEAEAHFRAAIQANPHHPEALYNLGNLCVMRDDPAQAVGYYRRAIQAAPGYWQAFFSLANAEMLLQQNEDALQHYLAVINLKPDFFDARWNRILLLNQIRRPLEAMDECRQALTLFPESDRVPYQMGLMLVAAGHRAQAIPYFEKSLIVNSNAIPALNNLAWLRATSADQPDPAATVQLAERLIELTGRREPHALDTLAAAYAAAGQFAAAVHTGEEALALAGDPVFKDQVATRLRAYREGRAWRE